MHSNTAMEWHFWLHTTGVLLYVLAMWVAGVTEGLMWRATNPDGSLTHAFIDSLLAIKPLYAVRWLGGFITSARGEILLDRTTDYLFPTRRGDRMTRQAGRSLIMVTHSRQIAAQADDIFEMHGGELQPVTRESLAAAAD